MKKLNKNEWVNTDLEFDGTLVTVIAKVLKAPRFNENVYYVEAVYPTGEKSKIYRSDKEITIVNLKDVITYHRQYGIQY